MSNRANLLSPGRIGTLELRNRIILSSMGTVLAEDDGTCGARIIAFNAARAKGGAALVNIGAVGVAYPAGLVMKNQVGISDDRFIPGLRDLARAVQAHGARIALQLQHGGPASTEDMIAGRPLLTASVPRGPASVLRDVLFDDEVADAAFGHITAPVTYREMDRHDIAAVIGLFAAAARRAVSAGVDAIELHAAHGFLIRSFLSPAVNRRTDEYGGSVENRARFLVEILAAIRAEIGPDFPLWCKINATEFNLADGFTVDDACVVARLAEAAGADAISASAYSGSSRGKGLVSGAAAMRPANYVPFAARIRRAVAIPVITAGRIELDVADRLLGDGEVDFIAMARKLLAEPDLPSKLAEGRGADVRPCIYCYTCISEVSLDRPVRCAVNGRTGRETAVDHMPTQAPRRVVVVGGGPGGMETARLLDRMGHAVTLLEASGELGGTARIAAIAYEPNGRIVDWLKRQLAAGSVDVRLGHRATLDTIRALQPDAVVVAVGAARPRPPIPGNDLPHVYDGNDLRHLLTGDAAPGTGRAARTPLAARALIGLGRKLGLVRSASVMRRASQVWMPLGRRIVVIGGDLVGLELAEFLAHRRRTVTVIDETPRFGRGLAALRRGAVLDECETAGVTLIPGVSAIAIAGRKVTCTGPDGAAHAIPADHVILACGATADRSLAEALRAEGLATFTVGDCDGVGYIAGAMRDAADVAARIG